MQRGSFFVREHILANMSFLSYAHAWRCACHALEPSDHWLMHADDIIICAISPHSVVAIRSASFNAPWFFSLGATTIVDWTRRTYCSALLADLCCDDIKHAMRHRANYLNTYCKNIPFSIKWYVYNCLYSIPTLTGEHLHLHITHKRHVCKYMFLPRFLVSFMSMLDLYKIKSIKWCKKPIEDPASRVDPTSLKCARMSKKDFF